jgi:hypothetical protein
VRETAPHCVRLDERLSAPSVIKTIPAIGGRQLARDLISVLSIGDFATRLVDTIRSRRRSREPEKRSLICSRSAAEGCPPVEECCTDSTGLAPKTISIYAFA